MKVVPRPRCSVLAWVAAFGIVAAGVSSHAKRQDSEQELETRIQSERNPAKKAKLEIQLGEVKLTQAVAAYEHDQFDAGPKFLEAYRGWMKQAWDLLEKSGRDAGHKPQGFKDLDISLRESARRLDDLVHRTPYEDRPAIEHVAGEIEILHGQVISALFPGGRINESPPPVPAKPANAPTPPALRPGEPPS